LAEDAWTAEAIIKDFITALSFAALGWVLAGCAGGDGNRFKPVRAQENGHTPVQIFPVQMMARLGDSGPIEMDPGFNASVVTTGLQDIAASVRAQAAAPADVALTFRYAKQVGEYDCLGEYWAEVRRHPNIKWVYMYDEMFWEGNQIRIGYNEQAITKASRLVQSVGLRTAVSVLPEVVLDPNFAFGDINVFDVVAVVVYPSLGIDWRAGPERTDANLYFATLLASVRKLREMGYRGEVWYVFQAFGDPDDALLTEHLELQREALARAPAIGISGAVSFGFYDDRHTNLPNGFYPGSGTDFEPLVMP
jgi:hypothetical protein